MSQGSGLVLLFHSMGEHDGISDRGRSTRAATAGSPRCSARPPRRSAREIKLERRGRAGDHRERRAPGVALADGTELSAKVVVSAADPRRRSPSFVDPRELPADLVDSLRRYRYQGTSSKVNFALDGLPTYPSLGERGDMFRGFTNIGPSMEYLERAFDEAKYGWYSTRRSSTPRSSRRSIPTWRPRANT